MKAASTRRRRQRDRRPLVLLLFLALLGTIVMIGRPVDAGAAGGGRLVAEPVLSAAAAGVRQLFGATPGEAQGEVWGVGEATGEHAHVVHYTPAGGWEAVPDPVDPDGQTVALPATGVPSSATAGRTTPAGGLVTVVTLNPESSSSPPVEDLIIRNPGGLLRAIPAPTEPVPSEEEAVTPSESEQPKEEAAPPEEGPVPPEPEPVLLEGEHLFKGGSAPSVDLTAVEEPDGDTGAFVAPFVGDEQTSDLVPAIAHFDGTEWHREKICFGIAPACKAPPIGFAVEGIEAAGSGQEWMLARGQTEGIVLLRREEGEWRPQPLLGPLGSIYSKREATLAGGKKATILARAKGQPLTVTAKGIWVDAEVTVEGQTFGATIYYDVGAGDPRFGEVSGSWCEAPETMPEPGRKELCEFPLPSGLSAGEGRSFAWPGDGGPGEEFGTRAITGVGQGAMLVFEHEAFSRIPLSGSGGSSAGAALISPEEGWLGPSFRLTREPVPSGLQAWPVPFRRPLLAVVPQPGVSVGSLNSQALAVGAAGEVARYYPGVGWQPESLLSGSGARVTPNLRAVAWPTPSFAYAVGDEGAMWLWRSATGLWEPDPGAPPNLIRGNFTGIAFDPEEPELGYAVGKQGLLLEYGKRWTQCELPAGLSPEINITSIAFAGHEAIATWMLAVPSKRSTGISESIGGLIVNDGSGCSGWRAEESVGTALSEVEDGVTGFAARRAAALPDGGAVVVGLRGGVVEREAAGTPWHPVYSPLIGYPSAVAAVREGGQLRALVSVSPNELTGASGIEEGVDRAQALGQPEEGQAPLLTEPYPLPPSGALIRQTATGWQDEQRQTFPSPVAPTDQKPFIGIHLDLPAEPDPILGIMLSPEGTEGWAVGGQTGAKAYMESGPYIGEGMQTASVERYGPAAAPPVNSTSAPIYVPETEATFAVGGGARCEGGCADLSDTDIGPEVWLRAAVGRAAAVPGLRGFLYTGGGVSPNLETETMSSAAFGEEESAYAERLGGEAGALPVFAAPSSSDLYKSSLATFASKFGGFSAPFGAIPHAGVVGVPGGEGERTNGNYSYSFDSVDSAGGGAVRVVVLDESKMPLEPGKLCWLAAQLAAARAESLPAIVVGNREVGAEAELGEVLVTGAGPACPQAQPGGASAYLFETEANTSSTLSYGSASIPAYGTGSLGYLKVPRAELSEFLPASGFLLLSVNLAGRSATTNVAPVSVRLIPSIGSLAIDARDGTLLRRSQIALFEALARRPIGGSACTAAGGQVSECLRVAPDPYVQIPARCILGHGFQSRPCQGEILPEYKFTSSRPDIADFVKVDPNSSSSRAVYLNSEGKTVPDPTSGLLCAFNSGTTVVSVETGGLSYSVPVTVQQGSVARPCGTVPRTDLPAVTKRVEVPPPPIEGKPGFKPGPNSIPPPSQPAAPTVVPVSNPIPAPPPSPVAHHAVPKPPPSPLQIPFFAPTPLITPLPVIVPPAPPAAAEPAPPTGTSPVTQPAVSPEPEEEEEVAFDLVHHAVTFLPGDRRPPVLQVAAGSAGSGLPRIVLPALLILSAAALAGAAGSRRRRSPELAFHRNSLQRRPPR